MGWTVSVFAVVGFASAAVAAAVGLASLRRRPDPMAVPLAALMFAIAAWAVPHAISLGYADVERVAFWHRLRYPGTVAAPALYLVVALRYAGHERWLSRRTYLALAAIPVATVVAVWTNPVHGLFWRSLSVTTVSGASVLVPAVGPWYWVNLAYLYGLTAAGLGVLATVAVRSGPIYRKQATLMFVGGLAPLATNAVVNLGVGPDPAIDLTPAAMAVSGALFALALYYFDLLDIRPVARDRLVDELDDGVVVVGPDDRVRDFNPTAARVLGDLEIDRPASAVFPSHVAPDGGELRAEVEGRERLFRTRSTTLSDGRGRETGRIVYLNEVTELVEREQRISVLNRVLRHNVRNELTVLHAHLDELAERTTATEHVEKAHESARRIVEFTEKARSVERTLQDSDATVVVSPARIVEQVVADARDDYPAATVECDLHPADARVVDGELFELALAELVENAVVHSDRESPRVTVRVEPDGEYVRVHVADDGPGIEDQEREVLTSRIETQLDHGSGLGLWLVQWTASLSAGELSFAENDPRGSVVTLSVPAADG